LNKMIWPTDEAATAKRRHSTSIRVLSA
jgi:hypothetical protein